MTDYDVILEWVIPKSYKLIASSNNPFSSQSDATFKIIFVVSPKNWTFSLV